MFVFCCFFAYILCQGFSFTNTDDSLDSRERKGAIFIPLDHLHAQTKIQKCIDSFTSEITASYF